MIVNRRLCRGAVTPSKNAGSQSRRPRFRRQRQDADCLTPSNPLLPDTALALARPGEGGVTSSFPLAQESDGLPCGRVASVLPPSSPIEW